MSDIYIGPVEFRGWFPPGMIARRPPEDAYWCPPKAVSLDEYNEIWATLKTEERWGHEGWMERGFDVIWSFTHGCWVTPQ